MWGWLRTSNAIVCLSSSMSAFEGNHEEAEVKAPRVLLLMGNRHESHHRLQTEGLIALLLAWL